ncbi:hypothetical protein RJZ56_003595 [Blastomyces dermatitidis]
MPLYGREKHREDAHGTKATAGLAPGQRSSNEMIITRRQDMQMIELAKGERKRELVLRMMEDGEDEAMRHHTLWNKVQQAILHDALDSQSDWPLLGCQALCRADCPARLAILLNQVSSSQPKPALLC